MDMNARTSSHDELMKSRLLGSSSRLIWRLTKSSNDTSGTKSAGRGPVAFRIAVKISNYQNMKQETSQETRLKT